MLESAIFHFVFIFFVLWAFIWGLLTKKKLECFSKTLIPTLLLKTFEFPKDRSLFVRSCRCLEDELSELLKIKVKITIPFSQLPTKCDINFLTSLFYLVWPQQPNNTIYFHFHENKISQYDLIAQLKLQKKAKEFQFHYEFENNIWRVKIQND